MKSSLIFLAGTFGFAAVSPLHAQTRSGFEIGAQVSDYNYREKVGSQIVAKDDGKFIGLTASYVQPIGSKTFLRATAASAFGSVDYSSDEGNIKNVYQDVTQVEFHLGHDLRRGDSATVTLFAGIGGRALDDESGGEETEQGFAGYDRRVGYAYIPLGVAVSGSAGGRMGIVVSAQYNVVVGGTAKSYFSREDSEFPDLKLDLDGGYGFEASAMLSAPLGRRAVRFGPFLRHWNINESKTKAFSGGGETEFFVEPANKTTEMGVRLSFAF